MAIHKFLVGINTAQLQDGVAHCSLHQHRNVAPCHHLNDHLQHGHAQHVLGERLVGQALVVALQRFLAHQMHDELQAHLAAHRCLTKDGADVEQANAAHFQQVLQQLGALAFDGGLVDAVQIHRIVCHQAVAARDQLQAQLALAQAGFARDHHAQAQNVHEHAVHGGAVGKVLGQVGTQHIDDERRRLVRGEHRNLRALAHGDQGVGRNLVVCQHQHRRLQGHDAGNAALAVVGRCVAEVRNLALAQNLHAVGVDVVEVTHQVCA